MVVKIKKNIKAVCYINFSVIDLFFKSHVLFDLGAACFALPSLMTPWHTHPSDIRSPGGS